MSKTNNKLMKDVQETLNDINDKLSELINLDKGSKTFIIIGWLLMALGGAGLIVIGIMSRTVTNYVLYFISSFLIILAMITGFSLAHKGFTGDWL